MHRPLVKTAGMAFALGSIVLFGVGCPSSGSVIEIWLVNDSGEFSITSAVITNDSDNSQSQELVSGNVAPNSTRLIVLATVEQFAEATVSINEAIVNGGIYPIVVKGDSAITYDAEYVPTDVGTKVLSTLQPVQAVQ